MPGVWIPMQVDLHTRREVIYCCQLLDCGPDEVVGQLLRFWGWAGNETADGTIPVAGDATAAADTGRFERAIGLHPGFMAALCAAGWLEVRETGLIIPNFDRWLSNSAKSRLQKTARQANWRATPRPPAARPLLDRLEAVDARPSTIGEDRTREDNIVKDNDLVVDVDVSVDFVWPWAAIRQRATLFRGAGISPDKVADYSLVMKICALAEAGRISELLFVEAVECVTTKKRRNPAAYLTGAMKTQCAKAGLNFLHLLAEVPSPPILKPSGEPATAQPPGSIPLSRSGETLYIPRGAE